MKTTSQIVSEIITCSRGKEKEILKQWADSIVDRCKKKCDDIEDDFVGNHSAYGVEVSTVKSEIA